MCCSENLQAFNFLKQVGSILKCDESRKVGLTFIFFFEVGSHWCELEYINSDYVIAGVCRYLLHEMWGMSVR